mgnify:CR=1 FL=1
MIYEIEKPNVWEWKSHTIYPDTGQTNWHTGTSGALRVQFDVGTSRFTDLGTGIINRWQNHNTYTYNNQAFQATRIHGIAGATWYLTGVQFEPGPVATPFEQRSLGQELALCQRYFFNVKGDNNHRSGIPGYANSTTELRACVQFLSTAQVVVS